MKLKTHKQWLICETERSETIKISQKEDLQNNIVNEYERDKPVFFRMKIVNLRWVRYGKMVPTLVNFLRILSLNRVLNYQI